MAKDNNSWKYRHFFWSSWAIQNTWNYERQMNMGYLYGMAPILDKIYIEGFEKLPEFVEKIAKSIRSDAKQFAKTFEKSDPIYVLGSGPTAEDAYATSLCLLLEMQWINSASIHSGEFFHGALEITDKDVPFILFMNEGKTRKLDERLLTFLLRFDAQVAVIDGKDFGLSTEFGSEVVDYFNPLVLTVVMRIYAEELSFIREHPLSKRRYMWKLEY